MADRAQGVLRGLFDESLRIVNLGLASFAETLRTQGVHVVHLDWSPPAGGDPEMLEILDGLTAAGGEGWIAPIAAANAVAVKRLLTAEPQIVGIADARDALPGMTAHTVLHAGPPVAWERMCGPLRGAVIGGLIYEGLAASPEAAEALAASGEIHFSPCHHHAAVGPMAGVVTGS
ncbi:MAG: DUF1116 domain-containing protein, partial [Candidatus Bipolaricaulota bacterium]